MGMIDRRRISALLHFGVGETRYLHLFHLLFSPFLYIRRRAVGLLTAQAIYEGKPIPASLWRSEDSSRSILCYLYIYPLSVKPVFESLKR